MYKSFPYHPTNKSFDPESSLNYDDIGFMVEHGFNVVRLYVAWQGVEPIRGQYNYTYLRVRTELCCCFCCELLNILILTEKSVNDFIQLHLALPSVTCSKLSNETENITSFQHTNMSYSLLRVSL